MKPWLGREYITFQVRQETILGIFALSPLYLSIWHSFKYKTNQIYHSIYIFSLKFQYIPVRYGLGFFIFLNFYTSDTKGEEIWTALNYLSYKSFAIWAGLYILFVDICFISLELQVPYSLNNNNNKKKKCPSNCKQFLHLVKF